MSPAAAFRYAAYAAAATALTLSASGAVARRAVPIPFYASVLLVLAVVALAHLVTRGALSRRLTAVGQLQALGALLLVSNLAVQATGGPTSPVIPLYSLLGIVLCWRFGVLAGVVGAGLVSVCEAAALLSARGLPGSLDPLLMQVGFLFAFTVGVGTILRRQEERSDSVQEKLATIEAGADRLAPTEEELVRRLTAEPAPQARAESRAEKAFRADRAIGELLELARLAIGGYTAAYFTAGADGRLRLRAYRSASQHVDENVVLKPGDNYVGLAVTQGKAIQLPSLSPAAARGVPYYLQFEGIRSLLAVPVRADGAISGVLVLDSAQRDSFVPEEQTILEGIAAQAEFIDGAARDSELSGHAASSVHQLYEAGRTLSQTLDAAAVLDQWLAAVLRLLRADAAYVAFRPETPAAPAEPPGASGGHGTLSVRASRGYRPEFAEHAAFDLETGLAATVLATGKPMAVDRPGETYRLPAGVVGAFAPAGSCLLVPLAGGALLQVDSRHPGHFGPIEIELVRVLSDHALLAHRNADLYRKMESLATTDGLTGLTNHRSFQERLADEVARASRTGRPLSLVLVDIDHFKRFNDSFGHQEGDRVLAEVAALLRETVRRGVDTAARYGGEEFVLVLPETDPGKAFEVADRIRRLAAEHLRGGEGDGTPVTLSLGLAGYPFDAASATELIDRADQALYLSKRQGRNRVTLYGRVRVKAEAGVAEPQPRLL